MRLVRFSLLCATALAPLPALGATDDAAAADAAAAAAPRQIVITGAREESSTATKTDTPIIETPQPITVVDDELYLAQGAISVSAIRTAGQLKPQSRPSSGTSSSERPDGCDMARLCAGRGRRRHAISAAARCAMGIGASRPEVSRLRRAAEEEPRNPHPGRPPGPDRADVRGEWRRS